MMNYIDHNRREAGKILGPVKTKFLRDGKEGKSHVDLISKKMYIPKFDGNLEKSLIGAHESHEALEYAKDLGMHSKYKLKNIKNHLYDIKSSDDLRKIRHTVNNDNGHFNSAVLGHDSNLLSRNFHDLKISNSDGALRGSRAEDVHFKNIAGTEFGTKVNSNQLHKLRYGYTREGAEKAMQEKFSGLYKINHEVNKISKKKYSLLNYMATKRGAERGRSIYSKLDYKYTNAIEPDNIIQKVLPNKNILLNMAEGNHRDSHHFSEGIQSLYDARLAFNEIADDYLKTKLY